MQLLSSLLRRDCLKKRKLVTTVGMVLLFIMSSCASITSADDPEYTVTIGLFEEDEFGEPQPRQNVFVKLVHSDSEEYLSGYTDSSGEYAFDLDDLGYGWEVDDILVLIEVSSDNSWYFPAIDGPYVLYDIELYIPSYPEGIHWESGNGLYGCTWKGYRPWWCGEGPNGDWGLPYQVTFNDWTTSTEDGWAHWVVVAVVLRRHPGITGTQPPGASGSTIQEWESSPSQRTTTVWTIVDDIPWNHFQYYEWVSCTSSVAGYMFHSIPPWSTNHGTWDCVYHP